MENIKDLQKQLGDKMVELEDKYWSFGLVDLKIHDVSYLTYQMTNGDKYFQWFVDDMYDIYQEMLNIQYPRITETYMGRTSSFHYDINGVLDNYFRSNGEYGVTYNGLLYYIEDYIRTELDFEWFLKLDLDKDEVVEELKDVMDIEDVEHYLVEAIDSLLDLEIDLMEIEEIYNWLEVFMENQSKTFTEWYMGTKHEAILYEVDRARDRLKQLCNINILEKLANDRLAKLEQLVGANKYVENKIDINNAEYLVDMEEIDNKLNDFIETETVYYTKILDLGNDVYSMIGLLTTDYNKRLELLETLA